ncbi:hypothetical protein GWK47_027291 [Chionoecetes opilio]|uniref:Uncharacterized protein n=1 Tax=Chionoecetes opilio TaxID=41210 RepID=A0A8J8WCE1_CHIOP|nr:hypothetical protein GWK47_027291 [Chionoecetes opilio]
MATERLQLPSFHHNVQDWLQHVQGYLANTSANYQQKFQRCCLCLAYRSSHTRTKHNYLAPGLQQIRGTKECYVRRVPKTRPPSSTGAANHHFGGHEAVYSVAADATNQYTVQHVIEHISK